MPSDATHQNYCCTEEACVGFYRSSPSHPKSSHARGCWTEFMVMSLTRYQTIKSIKVSTKAEPNTYNYFIIHCLSLESLQNFCSTSAPSWPPESVLRIHLGPLGQSCVTVCQRSSHMCEPALFHHLNSPAAFTR